MRKKWKEEIKKQGELIDFLCQNDRKAIAFEHRFYGGYVQSFVKFIYNKELKVIELPCRINCWYEVVEDKEYYCVIKETTSYYKIEKESGQITSITDFYKEKKPEITTTDEKADTPTETDFTYFTPEQVRKMSHKEVRENYSDIMKSMKKW